jgi:hypothetical protein
MFWYKISYNIFVALLSHHPQQPQQCCAGSCARPRERVALCGANKFGASFSTLWDIIRYLIFMVVVHLRIKIFRKACTQRYLNEKKKKKKTNQKQTKNKPKTNQKQTKNKPKTNQKQTKNKPKTKTKKTKLENKIRKQKGMEDVLSYQTQHRRLNLFYFLNRKKK